MSQMKLVFKHTEFNYWITKILQHFSEIITSGREWLWSIKKNTLHKNLFKFQTIVVHI